ncbi:T9SS type A sorting domain-containing protein, partial [Sphingobacteriales bacterium CHB3]|nr:T9SS type A sorting domain-containing protein [Sphingobacteriales bacterium CHB3]
DVAAQAGITDAVISWGVTWVDFNNDGYEDFFVAVSGQSTSCLLYKNNGDGTFTNVTSQAGLPAFAQLSAAWGDYDNDGDMDLYTSGAASAGNHLFRNNSDTTNKWLKVNLVGSIANRFGVGARIEVYAGSLRMMREVNTAIGYRSQNMLTAHFGLAGNTLVDSIVVRWPNRQQTGTVLRNVGANQVLALTEIPGQYVEELNSPGTWRLEQNYPNPFNPATVITFTVPVAGSVRLSVFDILGKEVAVLVHETRAAGTYTVSWNAERIGSGVYFYRLEADGIRLARKMQLLK